MASTLGDVFEIHRAVWQLAELFGSTREFDKVFKAKYKAIGTILREDLGISVAETRELTKDQELTPRAEEAFKGLKSWLQEQE